MPVPKSLEVACNFQLLGFCNSHHDFQRCELPTSPAALQLYSKIILTRNLVGVCFVASPRHLVQHELMSYHHNSFPDPLKETPPHNNHC